MLKASLFVPSLMKSIQFLARPLSIAAIVILVACRPTSPVSETQGAARRTALSSVLEKVSKAGVERKDDGLPRHEKTGEESVVAAPTPMEAFDFYCYRSHADYRRVVAMAEAMRLTLARKGAEAIFGADVGTGKAFLITNDKVKGQVILLGVSDQNTCSIFSQGFGQAAIRSAMEENFRLKQIFKDDLGLQVKEMHVPGGVKGTQGEASESGIIGLIYAKDPSFDQITVSFIPPATAQKVFSATP